MAPPYSMVFQDRVRLVHERRAKAGPLPCGIAPAVTSQAFAFSRASSPPTPNNWEADLSTESRLRQKSTLKATTGTANPSNIISLGTARPNGMYFPWTSLTLEQTNLRSSGNLCQTSCRRGEEEYDLAVALNYGFAAGSPQLLRFITEHVQLIHNPPYSKWETCLNCGTTAAIEMVFRMLCDRGDAILTEAYTYSGAIEAAKPLGLRLVEVEIDDVGLSSQALERLLSSWDHSEGLKPRVLYTIPTGQNPSGRTQTAARRHEIYAVACKHNLCIIEDDPYYFLQLSGCYGSAINDQDREIDAYLESLPPSYLSIDTSGRVLRLDSASKILAPGLRCGWLTACSELIAKFLQHTEFSTVSPSGPSQVMLYKLLDQTWGHEGFLHWLIHLSTEYQRRRNTLIQSCAQYLNPDICSWKIPTSGMFLWLRIDWLKHPTASFGYHGDERAQVVHKIEDRLYVRIMEDGVQVSKGSGFRSTSTPARELYFRLTFAAAPESSLEDGVKIIAKIIQAEFS